MSFQADSRSMLNLPDIQRNMTKTFTKPLRKIINNFTKPNTPKGKNCMTPKNTNFSILLAGNKEIKFLNKNQYYTVGTSSME